MIDLNDLQKPATAVLVIGAVATVGFVAGYMVGRDPALARGLVRSLAGGLTRLQVAAADAWETLGDAWADARAEAQRDIEAERFAADAGSAEAPADSAPGASTVLATASTSAAAATAARRRGAGARRKKAKKAPGSAPRAATRRVSRRKAVAAAAS